MLWLTSLAVSVLACLSSVLANDEDFSESLYVRPLPDGKVLSHFEFTTSASHARWEGLKVDDGISCG